MIKSLEERFSDKYMVSKLIKTFYNSDEQKSFKLTCPYQYFLFARIISKRLEDPAVTRTAQL